MGLEFNNVSQLSQNQTVIKDSKKNEINNNESNDKEIQNQQKIQSCYNELGTYSAPSMDNICSIWNNGFKSEGNNFYSQHMGFCDEYGNAAQAYGQAVLNNQSENNLDSLLDNIVAATQKAVSGLKNLITQEESFINKNISSGNDNNQQPGMNNLLSSILNPQQTNKSSNGLNNDQVNNNNTASNDFLGVFKTVIKSLLG